MRIWPALKPSQLVVILRAVTVPQHKGAIEHIPRWFCGASGQEEEEVAAAGPARQFRAM